LTPDKKLKGAYLLKVQIVGKEDLLTIPAVSKWVEQNFSKKALATAQKTFFDALTQQPITTDGKEVVEYEAGFVNVENENKYVLIDDNEINMLKYIPEKDTSAGGETKYEKEMIVTKGGKKKKVFKLDKDGQKIPITDTVIEAHWKGYCKKTKKLVPLEEAFVFDNFTPGFIEQVKKMAGKTCFISIPPGNSKRQDNVPMHLQTGPDVKFQQQEGQKTCLTFSFASALHHVGACQVASEIYSSSKKIIERHDTVCRFANWLSTFSGHLHFKKLKVHK
jgi:hypothetical protein